MNLLDMFRSKPAEEERSQADYAYGNFSITSFFGDGAKVTEKEALKIPAIAAGVELISSSIAQLPIYLYKRNEKGEVEKISDNRDFLLNNEPNHLMNGYNFKKQLVRDYLFHGASYTKLEKNGNNISALYNLQTEEVTVTKYRNGYKENAVISIAYADTKHEFIPEELFIVLRDTEDGVTSTGILVNNSDTIKLALDEQDYTIGILKNGALPIGILKSTSRLTEKAISRLRDSWENLYGGAKKAGKTLILEEGLDYKPISMKPNELDLTNVRKNTVSEIARILNIPESMINSSANKYASNEQNNIHFLQYCVSPVINAIESSLNKSLLLESEKRDGYYFHFDVSELLRTTEKEKIETVVHAMKNGLLSINESRSRISMPKINVDYFTWGLGSVFYNPETGDMTIPNMGVTIDPDNPMTPTDPNSHNIHDKQLPKDDKEEV